MTREVDAESNRMRTDYAFCALITRMRLVMTDAHTHSARVVSSND
jgi:hypothetical protein